MERFLIALTGAAIISGCATAYQQQSFSGGFDETQLDRNVFGVSFKGNGFTAPERATDLALLRCAELTLANGYRYFAVIDAQQRTKQSAFTTPTQSYTTGTASGTAYRSGNAVYGSATGSSQTTTYGGDTIVISKPSATNTIVLLKERNEIKGVTYDAQFLYSSLSQKYGVGKK
jgi:hypothetical protein